MQNTTGPSSRTKSNVESVRPLRFIVVGAGVSGVMAAIKLRAAGYDNIVVYEKADGAGGTWRKNTYPGVACDIPSHFYSYSFALNPNWSKRYAGGEEIQHYIEDTMRRFGVERLIHFNTEITHCEWRDGRWQVVLSDGTSDVADVVIAATGVLDQPVLPAIPGRDSFAGAAFHTARWNHDVVLKGKRVGVIGTGSSAIQVVSALASQVGKLTLFQRTAQWIMPQDNATYSEEELARFRDNPEALANLRAMLQHRFTESLSNALLDVESPAYQAIEAACVRNLETQVTDATLREQLRPNYRAACKRLVVSQDFYQAIQRPNVELVTDNIECIEPSGVRTNDQSLHELDVLVFATGFSVDRFIRPMQIVGREGTRLDDIWNPDPKAYLMVTVPSLPNFFMLNGPNSPIGNYPLIEVAEKQMEYALQLIALLRDGLCREVSPTVSATNAYESERIAAAKKTVWASGCNSYYLDASNLPTAWPWTIEHFYSELAEPKLDAFELRE